ncbi:MAG: helix-turn-helix transcriptional regulator [Candidatus Sifarchaeia archaeon]
MRTPELKSIILKLIGNREFYGYEMHKELEEMQIRIGIGRLYSVLAEMKKEGLLEDRWERSQAGPRRRVYHIGRKGKNEREKLLMEAIRTVHEFYVEYLLSLPPKMSVFKRVSKDLAKNLSKNANIGYVASKFSDPVRRIIRQLRDDVPDGRVFAISSDSANIDLGIDNVVVIEGSFEDIPMKDDYLNLLVVTGNLQEDNLDAYLSEWRRVIGKDGALVIAVPTATITSYEDPMGIGEFIEQREHSQNKSETMPGSKVLQEEMKHFFKVVKETKVVHISLLVGEGIA